MVISRRARCGPNGRSAPRDRSIGIGLPERERAAVAPSATTSFGAMRSSSREIHQRQTSISPTSGRCAGAALAALLELEMLHRIGDVDARALDPRFGERPIEEPAGRPDERSAGAVLGIPRLLAHEHHLGIREPSPKTVCVAPFHKGQARQARASSRTRARLVLPAAAACAASTGSRIS